MTKNKNYAFKYEDGKTVKSFKDNYGTSKMTIEGDNAPLNMPEHVTLANRPKSKKMADIGPRSNGFAGVATLATIIAIAGVVIAYLVLKY